MAKSEVWEGEEDSNESPESNTGTGSTEATPAYKRRNVRIRYAVLDNPPWIECLILGFQHYLTMLGSTVLIPFLLVPAMGGNDGDLAHVIQTIFFVSGLCTLLQTLFGDRLPIIQGGSFAYLQPAFAIIAQIQATKTFPSEHERFVYTMRVLQGGILASGLMIAAIGATGLLSALLHTISPITVAANIAIVGLSLFNVGWNGGVGNCVQLGLPVIVLIILFSQYLRKWAIPLGGGRKWRIFELLPVLLALVCVWIYGIIMTQAGVYDNSSAATQAACRTDQTSVLKNTPWFRFPYPGQWGTIVFTWSSTLTLFAGAISAMVESLGDYYAAASICGAPVPPPAVLGRAVTWQGLCCVIAGLFGTANGTTAYNENIGAMQITGVGSRRVVQVASVLIMIVAVIGKFGGLFASMPQAMVSGLFCVMFGIIAAVGLSQMQHTDQNSPRNLFILGFGLYSGLSIPFWFTTYQTANKKGLVATNDSDANNILNAIFSTGAAVALIVTLFLDNTVPGTKRERGLHVWTKRMEGGVEHWWHDPELYAVYGLPFGITKIFQARIGDPARKMFKRYTSPAAPACSRLSRGICCVATCNGCIGDVPEAGGLQTCWACGHATKKQQQDLNCLGSGPGEIVPPEPQVMVGNSAGGDHATVSPELRRPSSNL